MRAQHLEYQRANKGRMREHENKRKYGLTVAEVEAKLTAQGGLCLICDLAIAFGGRNRPTRACVDHDHRSGKVRGILCNMCNTLLGRASDSISRLARAARYLSRFS